MNGAVKKGVSASVLAAAVAAFAGGIIPATTGTTAARCEGIVKISDVKLAAGASFCSNPNGS